MHDCQFHLARLRQCGTRVASLKWVGSFRAHYEKMVMFILEFAASIASKNVIQFTVSEGEKEHHIERSWQTARFEKKIMEFPNMDKQFTPKNQTFTVIRSSCPNW